jgi:mono/diheme cytochrome c family protein
MKRYRGTTSVAQIVVAVAVAVFVEVLTLQLRAQTPKFDPAVVAKGEQRFVANCGFCHGPTAKGGEGGPDLIRSRVVVNDDGGRQLGAFLRAGRPDQGMPTFDRLGDQQVAEIATFLHSRIAYSAGRGAVRPEAVLVGDSIAGRTFFNGDGQCVACHSPLGDLKGIGSKYDVQTVQDLAVMPPRSKSASKRATVTFVSGLAYSGILIRLTDFDVSIVDGTGDRHTFFRSAGEPRVEVTDPLQHHIDLASTLKDGDMHNLTAYLMSLR